jgi:hypothetical protein
VGHSIFETLDMILSNPESPDPIPESKAPPVAEILLPIIIILETLDMGLPDPE